MFTVQYGAAIGPAEGSKEKQGPPSSSREKCSTTSSPTTVLEEDKEKWRLEKFPKEQYREVKPPIHFQRPKPSPAGEIASQDYVKRSALEVEQKVVETVPALKAAKTEGPLVEEKSASGNAHEKDRVHSEPPTVPRKMGYICEANMFDLRVTIGSVRDISECLKTLHGLKTFVC